MDYIAEMKSKQILFNLIDEQNALKIMQTEYSYYQLMEYAQLFAQYVKTEKKGTYVHLEFAQIYYLAIIDEKLRHLIIQQCLELEKNLKLQLINLFNEKSSLDAQVLHAYILQDKDYLLETYKSTKYDILQEKYSNHQIDELSLEQFLDVIQFGTLERFWIFCCSECMHLPSEKINIFEEWFASARYLRNSSAHNNSILSHLLVKVPYNQQNCSPESVEKRLRTFGIRQKTLRTNMSKKIIRDLCNFMFLCKEIKSTEIMLKNCNCWNTFLVQTYADHIELFVQNEMLTSAFTFLKNVNTILLDELQKST